MLRTFLAGDMRLNVNCRMNERFPTRICTHWEMARRLGFHWFCGLYVHYLKGLKFASAEASVTFF
ncbi:hypothetical protein CEB3_c06060 [Peptococcaceae bacterium CEB3]|nr:hypothetical protein CEB3_c06060 [Peptococcaceae bacterium CEB3]